MNLFLALKNPDFSLTKHVSEFFFTDGMSVPLPGKTVNFAIMQLFFSSWVVVVVVVFSLICFVCVCVIF